MSHYKVLVIPDQVTLLEQTLSILDQANVFFIASGFTKLKLHTLTLKQTNKQKNDPRK